LIGMSLITVLFVILFPSEVSIMTCRERVFALSEVSFCFRYNPGALFTVARPLLFAPSGYWFVSIFTKLLLPLLNTCWYSVVFPNHSHISMWPK
jgi:hypothetical protein